MSLKKRRYVGNANSKKRQEVEGTFGSQLHCRRAAGHPQQTLPSPERPPPLLRPSPPGAVNSTPPPQRIQDLLVQNILRHQHETKNFKTESWYGSPAGYGAISNAIIAALSIKDNARTGYVSVDDIVDTFTKMNFGLKEDQVRQLFREVDNNAEQVHYKSFAKQFDLPPTVSEDPIARHERTVALLQERLKEPSRVPIPSSMSRRKKPPTACVLEEITPAPPTLPRITVTTTVTEGNTLEKAAFNINHLAHEGTLPSPTRYSAKLADGVIPQTATTLVLGGDMRNTPKSLRRARLLPQVVDQSRKEGRRKAKREILTNHLERIDTYAAAKDYETKLYEENHLKATTAKHLAYNQAFLEQALQRANKVERKGLLDSAISERNHNVSMQSMFFQPDAPR
ncbi:hypothetical protein SDRG_08309 [Saprolegnia diclina VS20]|uniref:EF-hand domain-containing protein n=1 Tax=Saprolegnia diclina (strain VS20) TaxID=1156394 RepID=T0QK16_SAPDV|nr:hypothetical protein SDRG_08309 [Saprolegnia diclina VS20]EQC34100.1 hypothetical protein SDRG_08309 [Saprolegnia diclina VS20]|eukprot:XP_008612412.1 hypothetical protein SDRG_08309 [Saprolegnia diclina VS20]